MLSDTSTPRTRAMSTLVSARGPTAHIPKSGFYIPTELAEIHERAERTLPGHILTGPVAVSGARPGQVLEVRVIDVTLRQDWGYNLIRPLAGTLPDDFHETRLLHIPLDLEKRVAHLPSGTVLPL